ncbi:MAG: hypothetical protein PHV33_12970 [Elusimicrobiales bacterium]|nr:hypothetical protein [Elusimicrobiales bacterium]
MDVKTISLLLGLLAAALPCAAQENAPETGKEAAPVVNSFYERGPAAKYALKSILVEGEVAEPGPVELAALPVREAAVKELVWLEGKPVFRGAYLFSGYSLCDILNAKAVKKAREDFKPETDLYVVVENAAGDKAVFSWGEIYYAANGYGALIARSARSVTAPKRNTDWPLPAEPRLVAANDLYNTRFIANPVKITVKSAPGDFPGRKHEAVYAPEFTLVYGEKRVAVKEAGKAERRSYSAAGYGHGTGFKGLKNEGGFLFKNILAQAGVAPQDSGDKLVVVSAGDAYRAAFSLAELVNRGDNADFLVVDNAGEKDGRFSLFSAADFFVDRNVRAMAKVEILKP